MARMRRNNRPGLVGLAARTAVVAGTASAVSGSMANKQQRKAQADLIQKLRAEAKIEKIGGDKPAAAAPAAPAAPAAKPDPKAPAKPVRQTSVLPVAMVAASYSAKVRLLKLCRKPN